MNWGSLAKARTDATFDKSALGGRDDLLEGVEGALGDVRVLVTPVNDSTVEVDAALPHGREMKWRFVAKPDQSSRMTTSDGRTWTDAGGMACSYSPLPKTEPEDGMYPSALVEAGYGADEADALMTRMQDHVAWFVDENPDRMAAASLFEAIRSRHVAFRHVTKARSDLTLAEGNLATKSEAVAELSARLAETVPAPAPSR